MGRRGFRADRLIPPVTDLTAPVGHPLGREETAVSSRLFLTAQEIFGVGRDELRSAKRNSNVTTARWALAFVLTDRVGWSNSRVGRVLQKDHTAITYARRKAADLLRTDRHFHEAVTMLENSI